MLQLHLHLADCSWEKFLQNGFESSHKPSGLLHSNGCLVLFVLTVCYYCGSDDSFQALSKALVK